MAAAAFVGGLASLGLQAYSQNAADERADLSFQRQKELMALQNQYAVQNWERENNYNHPKEQMKRLKAAGLNPDLMYGNGAAGLQGGSISALGAPASPMAPTMDFSKSVNDAISAAVGMEQAKKANSETIRQDIENSYLNERYRTEIDKMIKDMEESGSRINLNNETRANVAQSTANMKVESDALQTRLGYEETDRLIAMFEAATHRAVAANQINDTNATQQARIFSLIAKGHLDEANSYIIGLFKNPEKAKEWISSWATVIKDTWKEIFGDGDDGKDSDGKPGYHPLNKNPKSKVAQFARSFFKKLDEYMCSFTGAEPVLK